MKNKKAWLRIVEAFIAVLIIASVLIAIAVTKAPKQNQSENVHEMQRFVLKQISLNETARAEVLGLNKDTTNVNYTIKGLLPVNWEFTTRICEVDEVCGMPFYSEKEVYADEILITSTLKTYSPKKLKLFMREK